MILFFPLFPVFPQLFQKLTVPGRMKGGEGAHQAALKDILTGVQGLQPLPSLGFGTLQPLSEFVAQLTQRLQTVLNGLSGLCPALCSSLPSIGQGLLCFRPPLGGSLSGFRQSKLQTGLSGLPAAEAVRP